MKGKWLHRQNGESVIIFCNGWGMDERPLYRLAFGGSDVFMVYDYRDLAPPEELDALFAQYPVVFLISWSMGVWAGQLVFSKNRYLFERTVAINGTLCPIDDRYGIPAALFNDTLKNFNETTRQKFYRRMCREKMLTEYFLANQPARPVDEQRAELDALKRGVDCLDISQSLYHHVIVAEKDMIIPAANQLAFWRSGNATVRQYPGPHYLFQRWSGWNDILAD